MRAVALLTRAELRTQLRAWLGTAALAGLIGGLVIAAAAGARRTDSAYERFLDHQRAADVLFDNYPDADVTTVDPAAVERLPQVAQSARADYLFIGETGAFAPVDGRLGRVINRPKLLEGRLANPRRANEMTVGFERAAQLGWHVGTTVPLIEPRYAADAARAGVRNMRLRVVGIVAAPGDFPPLEQGAAAITLTPAFHRAYAGGALLDDAGRAVLVRLRGGEAALGGFRAGVRRLNPDEPAPRETARADRSPDVNRAMHLQATALWLLAGALTLVGLVIAGGALIRQAAYEPGVRRTLHAIGMTRRQLWAVGLLRALAIGLLGAGLAMVLAVALSPLTPLGGLARTAEPDRGFAADTTVLAIGAGAIVLATLIVAAPAAWAAAGARSGRQAAAVGGGLADRLARLGGGVSLVTGLRMALQPAARAEVPARTAILGLSVALLATAAALTFAASSARLLDTPRLHGWNWDLAVTHYGSGPDLAGPRAAALRKDPAIAEATAVDHDEVQIGGLEVVAMGFTHLSGAVLPPVTDGRAPEHRGEIMLGRATMRTLHVGIGDAVSVGHGTRRLRVRVVGTTVFSGLFSNAARLGQGAVILRSDLRALGAGVGAETALLRLVPGADRPALIGRLRRTVADVYELPQREPLEIVDFGRIRALPVLLAALLAGLAAAMLAQTLVTSTRRHQADFAVLKAIGFERAQVRAAVLAHAAVYTAAALLLGLPLGIAAGRLAWNVYAEHQGLDPEVVVPVVQLLAAAPAALLAAIALAMVPARRAAALDPAVALRAE